MSCYLKLCVRYICFLSKFHKWGRGKVECRWRATWSWRDNRPGQLCSSRWQDWRCTWVWVMWIHTLTWLTWNVCNSASFKWVEVQRKVLKMYRYIPTKNDKIIKLNGHISNVRYFPSRIQIYSFLKWTTVANCSNPCLSCWSACCLSPPLLLPWPSSHQTWCRCRDELASVSAAYVSPSTPKQSHNHGVFFVKTIALENYVAHDGLARSIANFPKLHWFHK